MSMARNRARRPAIRWQRLGARASDWLRHSVTGLAVLGGLCVAGAGGWAVVQRSSYFNIRTVEATETAHLNRDTIVGLAGLDGPVNLFRYDALVAEEALGSHPWVASAHVEKRMPDRVEIRLSERVPAAVAALGALYVVDADGQPFIRATPSQAQGLPLVTGLSRELYEANPGASRALVRDALALERLYQRSELAAAHPLSNVHVGEGGRLELMLGRSRIVMGQGDFRTKLDRLARIFETLGQRGVEASYVLMDEKGQRSIVREVSAARPIMGSL